MLRYKSSKLDFILLNKPKSEDNLPVKLNGQYIWFFLKNTQFEVIIWSFCYWKKELYLVKSQQWASMNQNGSAAVPNFGRGFKLSWEAWLDFSVFTKYYSQQSWFCINLVSVLSEAQLESDQKQRKKFEKFQFWSRFLIASGTHRSKNSFLLSSWLFRFCGQQVFWSIW